MGNTPTMTYEESVYWLRQQPEMDLMVKLCYLDANNLEAAKRYQKSEEFQEISKLLKLPNVDDLKILDLGCGNGIASYALASTGHSVYSVDPDESLSVGLGATEKLISHLNVGRIQTFKGTAENIPFGNNTFDIIFTRQALHHYRDLEKALKECHRVLKDKGQFLAVKEHVVDSEEQLKQFLNNHLLHKFNGGENAYPLDIYRRAIINSGFKIERIIAPFDSAINQFGISNQELHEKYIASVNKKFGLLIGRLLSSLVAGFGEHLFRQRLSSNKFPGRLYSFLCIKTKE